MRYALIKIKSMSHSEKVRHGPLTWAFLAVRLHLSEQSVSHFQSEPVPGDGAKFAPGKVHRAATPPLDPPGLPGTNTNSPVNTSFSRNRFTFARMRFPSLVGSGTVVYCFHCVVNREPPWIFRFRSQCEIEQRHSLVDAASETGNVIEIHRRFAHRFPYRFDLTQFHRTSSRRPHSRMTEPCPAVIQLLP